VEEASAIRAYGRVFDGVAAEYDAARPSYAPELVDAALAAGVLAGDSAVLEIGSGTGKLTELLVARGLRVHAIEPGANLIEAARRRLGPTDAVQLELGRFEDADLPEGSYDAVFSATAFHWVEPQIGWAKVASLLRPRGMLALLAYIGVEDERSAALEEPFVQLVREHAPVLANDWRAMPSLESVVAGARARRANASEVWDWVMSDGRHALARPEAAELFDGVEIATVLAREEQTAGEVLAHLRTSSFYFRIPEDRREAFEAGYRRVIEGQGGTFPFSRADVLMTARKSARHASA
jgi:SAM-dependent methyltransferase